MNELTAHESSARAQALLRAWLDRSVPPEDVQWLNDTCRRVAAEVPGAFFFTRFSLAQRRMGKADLNLEAIDLLDAEQARSGWNPEGLTCAQAARTLIALSPPSDDEDVWRDALDRIFAAADVGESVVLYRALPLFPHPDHLVSRCAEGVRTNMRAIFEAVAHRNPFPAERLDEAAWNQLVLKALFIGSALQPIQRLDERANPRLARILLDFVHERWAAGRDAPSELWRCVGPFADDEAINDLARVMSQGGESQRQAAALALHQAASPRANEILEAFPDMVARIAEGALDWETLGGEDA